jgi:23S rRNA (adenine2503-C2)-methyltransferase
MSVVPVALVGLSKEGFLVLAEGLGLKPYQVRDMYRWTYHRRVFDPLMWTSLPKTAREALAVRCSAGLPEVLGEMQSADGTVKFLFGLADGNRVEAVYIPDGGRRTLCISSQVGCALQCVFCLTGTLGLARNLSAGEIVGQVLAVESRTDLREFAYNIVFMGMGEPLANMENLLAALAILEDSEGVSLSKRRITISTSGLADALESLAENPLCPQLALSLGSAKDPVRDRLMPINRRFPLARLRRVLEGLARTNRQRVSIEYTLLKDENDSDPDARALVRFAQGLKVKVNLIRFNGAQGLPFKPAGEERTKAFQRILLDANIATSIRKSRGDDIFAACGQLALRGGVGE